MVVGVTLDCEGCTVLVRTGTTVRDTVLSRIRPVSERIPDAYAGAFLAPARRSQRVSSRVYGIRGPKLYPFSTANSRR